MNCIRCGKTTKILVLSNDKIQMICGECSSFELHSNKMTITYCTELIDLISDSDKITPEIVEILR